MIAVFAVLVYVAIRMIEKFRAARRGGPPTPPRPQQRRVIAPDDDPDFLRGLRFRDQKPDDPR